MSLEIQQHDREGIAVLEMNGRITVGKEATALREKVAELAAANVRKTGGNVKLVNLNRRNIELLVMTKLATVFEIFTDEGDAVGSYYPDRKIKTFDILDFVNKMKTGE